MLNHTFTFNGHSSDEFGIKIERFRAFNRSARKYDYASVPGRNGNIYNLQQAWEEISVSYQIWAKEYSYNIADVTKSGAIYTGNGTNGYIINGTPAAAPLAQFQVLEKTYDHAATVTIKAIGDVNARIWWWTAYTSDPMVVVDEDDVTTSDQTIEIPAGMILHALVMLTVGTAYDNVFIKTEINEKVPLEGAWTKIMEWLNSADGYARLEDTYDTVHYYQAVFVEATDVENFWNQTGRAVVTFRCRPERFLADALELSLDRSVNLAQCVDDSINLYRNLSTSSEVVGTLKFREFAEVIDTNGTWRQLRKADGVTGWAQTTGLALFGGNTVVNTTGRIARPLVTMTNRTADVIFQINEQIMEIAASFDDLIVDCETEYITGTPEANYNLQTYVYDYNGVLYDFPYLKPGTNYIVTSGADMTMEARMWEI